MKFNAVFRISALVMAMGLSGGAWANEAVADQVPAVIAQDVDAAVPEIEPVEVSSLGQAVNVLKLDGYRGGFDLVKNDMQLSGTVANNSTYNVASGNNLISGGAFANANGFPTVVQNSGSNVLIQNATIINLQYE